MKKISIWGAALALLGLMGCVAEGADEAVVGQLSVPLYSQSASGTTFVLTGSIGLTGPETITVERTFADIATYGMEDRIELNPRVGTYAVALSNWALYTVDLAASPAVQAVSGAVLTSPATVTIEIVRDTTSYVSFAFNVPGSGMVVFARGALGIDFTVDEGYPAGAACTASEQCASLVCGEASGTCLAASCSDGIQNGDETSPDCGPSCACGGTGVEAPCNAAQQAECPFGAMCTANTATNVVTCSAVTCTATQAQQCPSDAMCSLDGAGAVVCTGGAPADPNLTSCVTINELSTNGPLGAPGAGTNEYVELYNRCAIDVSLTGVRLLYRSAAGTTNTTLQNLPEGAFIGGGGYLLYANNGFTDVAADGVFTNGLALAGGGVALTYGATIVDSVGYGTATNAFIEGTAAIAPAEGASISRTPNGTDTNNNAADFIASPRTPRAAN